MHKFIISAAGGEGEMVYHSKITLMRCYIFCFIMYLSYVGASWLLYYSNKVKMTVYLQFDYFKS